MSGSWSSDRTFDLLVVAGGGADAQAGETVRDIAAAAAQGVAVAVTTSVPGLPRPLLDAARRGTVTVLPPARVAGRARVVLAIGADAGGAGAPVVERLEGWNTERTFAALDRAAPGWRPGAKPPPPTRSVLMISSNGSGMGHLTRLMAMSRRASPGTRVEVLSMSSAVPLAAGDVPHEYVPSPDDLGISARRWNPVLERRLDRAVERLQPDVLVFDGTYPYRPIAEVGRRHPRLRTVWSRRPMWQPGKGARQLQLSSAFDLVLEPGELAGGLDRGLTVGRTDALRVRPITLLDPEDALPRERAREELGVEPGSPAVLMTLGAGSWQDVDSDLGAVVAGFRDVVPEARLHLVRPSIARSTSDLGDGVRSVSAYPLSRYLPAFDVVVTAAGYNTFHEAIGLGAAGAFVGVAAQLDDQLRRAAWAEREGAGLDLRPRDPASVRRAAQMVTDPALAEEVSSRCRSLWPGNGAAEAMAAVEAVADGAGAGDLLSSRTEVPA